MAPFTGGGPAHGGPAHWAGGGPADVRRHGGLDVPAPLSRERLIRAMRALRYHYFVDASDDVGGMWSGRLFHFYLLGDSAQVLQVRGRWNRRVSIERIGEILALCDHWNRELIWPKCYIRVLDDGFIHVMSEVSTPFASGATDAQILACIQGGLSTSGVIFDALDERYPDPAASPP